MGGALIKTGWVITVASQLFIGTRLVRPKEVKVVLGMLDVCDITCVYCMNMV